MKWHKTYQWISEADFAKINPLICKVLGHVLESTKDGKEDHRLQFVIEQTGAIRQMSIFGDNFNCFVAMNEDDEKWIGAKFLLHRHTLPSGDNRNTIENLRSGTMQ